MRKKSRFMSIFSAVCLAFLFLTAWNVPGIFAQVSPPLTKFVDPLVIPPAFNPSANPNYPGADYYEIGMQKFLQKLHSSLPSTPVYGYGGPYNGIPEVFNYPAFTIEATMGKPVVVKWTNELPLGPHMLPQDYTLMGTTDMNGNPWPDDNRAIPHLHGGHDGHDSDGDPRYWLSPVGSSEINPYLPQGAPRHHVVDTYPNDQDSATLWYHDHAWGVTRFNPFCGLAGFYLIRDQYDTGETSNPGAAVTALNIPKGDYEIPLAIQDKIFNNDGTFFYPDEGVTPLHPVWVPEYFGDTAVVNGVVYPYLRVEPRRYRLRILNGSNARFYNLSFDAGDGPIPFFQIGGDGGLLFDRAAKLKQLLIAPGERADIIFDFKDFPMGKKVILKNDAPAPYPGGGEVALPEIMQFRVNKTLSSPDDTTPPGMLILPPGVTLIPTPGVPKRDVVMKENEDPITGNPIEVLLNGKRFTDPVEEKPKNGNTEIWQFINLTIDGHPMHMHLVRFQILNRQPFDVKAYTRDWNKYLKGNGPKPVLDNYLTKGPIRRPEANEIGWKDTAKAYPGEVLRVIAKFDVPILGNKKTPWLRPISGKERYVYHCHILEHEENDMMRPFEVTVP